MIGILGGGLTGLTLGYLLKQRGMDFEILEKENECGGLMRSLKSEGFTFDYGGSHILFSKDKKVLDFLLKILGSNKIKRRRNTKIFYKNRYVKYPFENGLHDLPEKDSFECFQKFVEKFVERNQGNLEKPKNLKEWCYYTFGEGIAGKYLIPYNEKIWKFPVHEMSTEWVERIPNPPLEDIVKSYFGIETEGYTHQLYFYYPKKGGMQALSGALKKDIENHITNNFEVRHIEKKGGKWHVSDGENVKIYDRIFSTIPIFDIIGSLKYVPQAIEKAANNLHYNSLITVMLGLNKTATNDISWLYIPDKNVLTHRISFPSNYSPFVSPQGKSSILAEITCNFGDNVWKMTEREILERVTNDLEKIGIINKQDICFQKVKKVRYAYIISDTDYRKNMRMISDYMKKKGIRLVGRFSEFEYYNMDACVKSAMEAVNSAFSSG